MKIKTWLIGLAVALGILLAAIGCHEKQQKGTSRDFDTINTGTGPNTGTGMTLLQQAQLLNDMILFLNAIGLDDLTAQDVLNLRHLDVSVRVESEGYYGVYDGAEQLAPNIPDAYADDPYDLFPDIHAFAGDTSNYPVPDKIGNLFIDTSASKVYVSVSTSRGGWVILNMILPLFYYIRRRRK